MSKTGNFRLFLASTSPRRAELLAQIAIPFEVLPAGCMTVDESALPDDAPANYAQRLAVEKAKAGLACLRDENAVVLGADTVVVLDGRILGKPASEAIFMANMRAMSGRSHEVLTAVAVAGQDGRIEQVISSSRVWFAALSPELIRAYWHSGEPVDKAGGYAIQGLAASFVTRIEGSYSGVMGLPLHETAELLSRFHIYPLWVRDERGNPH